MKFGGNCLDKGICESTICKRHIAVYHVAKKLHLCAERLTGEFQSTWLCGRYR